MRDIRHFFHRTSHAAAEAILRDGFQDISDTGQTDSTWRGTWFCDNEAGAPRGFGDVVLEVQIPTDVAERYYWGCDQGYREYLS